MYHLIFLLISTIKATDSGQCASLEERLGLLEFAVKQVDTVQSLQKENCELKELLGKKDTIEVTDTANVKDVRRKRQTLTADVEVVQQGNVVTIIPTLYRGWTVQFDIKPYGTVSGWNNILHMTTTDNNCCKLGDRVPAMWFHSDSTKPHIMTVINDKSNLGYNEGDALPMNAWSNIKISQLKSNNGNYVFSVEINGLRVFKMINTSPKTWSNVNVYNSNPWHPAAKVIINNLQIDTKPGY